MKQSRRNFIRQTGILTALALGPLQGLDSMGKQNLAPQKNRLIPKGLKKGDLIGLVTPGSPVTREQLDGTIEKLGKLGFCTTYNNSVLSEYGYFAGPDQERADELMEMFSRPEIKGIWCVRGGYGSIRILDKLDYQVIAKNPKVLIGYSDVTAIHTALFRETGLVTFHGPLGISDFNRFTEKSLLKAVMGSKIPRKIAYRREKGSRGKPEFDSYTIRGGTAEGILSGGNVSVLDSMIGSRFEPDFNGRIAYLEEIEEKTYRVDKMLFHLLSATNLKSASGIMLGVFSGCNVNEEPRLTLRQAIQDLFEPLGIPVSYGHSFGHISRMVTVPNGTRARLDADAHELELLEAAIQNI